MSEDESLWLKNLRGNLTAQIMGKVLTEMGKQHKTMSLGAYLEVISQANSGLFEEVLEMQAPTLKQMIMDTKIGAGWIAEWQSQAEAVGMEKGIAAGMDKGLAEVARNLKASGMSCDLIAQYTGLPAAKVKKL